MTVCVALVFKDDPGKESERAQPGGWFWRCLTFELRRHRRWDARARMAKMYCVPPAGPAWHAVGARLERGVRHCCVCYWQHCRHCHRPIADKIMPRDDMVRNEFGFLCSRNWPE